jgi:hypothetical protein
MNTSEIINARGIDRAGRMTSPLAQRVVSIPTNVNIASTPYGDKNRNGNQFYEGRRIDQLRTSGDAAEVHDP